MTRDYQQGPVRRIIRDGQLWPVPEGEVAPMPYQQHPGVVALPPSYGMPYGYQQHPGQYPAPAPYGYPAQYPAPAPYQGQHPGALVPWQPPDAYAQHVYAQHFAQHAPRPMPAWTRTPHMRGARLGLLVLAVGTVVACLGIAVWALIVAVMAHAVVIGLAFLAIMAAGLMVMRAMTTHKHGYR